MSEPALPPDEPELPPQEPALSQEEVADLVEEGRHHPSTIGGIFYLVVLALTTIGIGIVWTGDWRAGIRWVAGGLLLAAVVRLVLPTREAGMLAVRHRIVDCVMLATVGVILVFLASTIPNQPL